MRALVLVLLAACTRPPAAPPVPAPTPTPATATASAPPTTQPVLLVANKSEATVSVLELPGGRNLATLPTANGPHEIAVSPDGRRAAVTGYGTKDAPGRSLTVIDVPSLSVTRTIDLGDYRRPHGAAFLPDGRRVVVTAEANAAVVIVDVEAGTVERGIPTAQQGTHLVALAPGGARAYTANIQSGTVTAIDLVAMTAAEPRPAIAECEAIAVTPDGTQVWTASLDKDRIVALDAKTLAAIGDLAAAGRPIRITPTPDGRAMLVSNVNGSALQLVDVATRTATTIPLPPRAGPSATPIGTVISPDSKTAYVALGAEDRVAVIDLATRTITGHLPAGRGPDGLGYSSAFVRK
ncbi:MAG TPA: beta-propeller fold lactonase family protein [Kofleriaceae bacterium]|nr:beta-propeller fold lactonase family protein [Kofleriaceae bacterium]